MKLLPTQDIGIRYEQSSSKCVMQTTCSLVFPPENPLKDLAREHGPYANHEKLVDTGRVIDLLL